MKDRRPPASTGPEQGFQENFPERSPRRLDMELAHLQKIFDAAHVGLLLVNSGGTIARVNDVITKLVGKNARDLIGKRPGKAMQCIETALLHHQCGEGESCPECPFRNTFEKALTSGREVKGVEAEKEFYLNGETIPLCFSLNASRMEIEGNNQVLLTLFDVTERKMAERKLREEKERFEQIASLAGEMVWEVDANGLYTYVSQASRKIFGYSPEELIGKRYFTDLHTEQDRGESKESVKKIFAAKSTIRDYENRAQTAEGREIILLTNGIPLFDERGDLLGYRGVDQEITERKTAETIAHEQKTLLSTILNAINAPVFYKDINGIYLGCNDAFEDFIGKNREQIVGYTAFDIAPKHLAERYHRADQQLLEAGKCQVYECSVYDTQGDEKNVMFHKAPFYDSQGQIAGLVGAMLDITEMKKTQKKLEESEQRHRLLFSSAKDALFLLAPPDWAFVDANPSAVELFGAESREQLIRRFPLEISPEHQPDGTKSSEKSLEMIRKAVEEGAHLFEWTHRTFDGNEFPAEVLLTSMSFDGRNYLLASVRNVTARKHAEEAIAEARDQAESEAAKLSAMISGMEDGLLFVDRDDRVVEVNEAFCRLLGKDRQEIQARPLESLELEKHIENFSNHLSAFRKQRLTEPCVCQTRLPDAEVIFRVLPIYRHRSFDGILISCIDITELADAKERLEASNRELEKSIARSHQLAEQSEMASKAKSEFLANMSHEIRTPMTAILGYTDLILESNKDPDTRNAASTIQRNGRHLLEIINDVLDLAKVESGKQKVELRRCSPHQVVDEVISMLRVQTEGKGLSLDVEYATPIPETIETDPARLRQILLNLIGNAIKFTELGGVTLKISLLQPPEGSARLRFNVIDTGIGMSKQQIAQLFQPFFQLDCSLSRKYGGTGLGLTISKHFAYMLGGDLTVQSQLGQGSDFLLTIETGSLEGIPMLDNVQEIEMRLPEEEKEKPIEPGMLSGRILLAEDGPDNQRLISLLLKKAGAQVELAENGQQAVERIEATGRKNDDAEEPLPPIDLILMDIQMPVLDGLEATRTLREQGYTNPILALTAHAMEQDIEKCRLAGCDGHLTKPIQRNLFFETIRKSLKRSRSAEGQPED